MFKSLVEFTCGLGLVYLLYCFLTVNNLIVVGG